MFEAVVEEGLVLRLLEPRHAEAIFRLMDRNRDSLGEWFPWVDTTKTVADSEAFIRFQLRSFAEGEGAQFGIWLKDEYIGTTGFSYSQESRCAEVGYWLGADYRGRGVATKVSRYLCVYLFDQLGLNRIEIRCAETNLKSRAVPERLGFTLEGTLREMGYTRDGWVGQRVYSLLKREWQDG